MRKNIKLIPLFLFLFVFQLLYFLSTIYHKLVDCLEKCLIYGHIRRFAD